MKIKGKKIEGPRRIVLVLPRDGEDIVLVFQAVMDMAEFDKLCPSPIPPMKMIKGGITIPDLENPTFKAQITEHATRRSNWMILKALDATPELTWDKIKMDDPSTWGLLQEELKEAGFSTMEVVKITNTVFEVNSLDESKLEEARQRFLATQQPIPNESSSQKEEQPSTPSGEPANGSESDRPAFLIAQRGKT